jgi:cell division protein FtsB
MLLLCGFLANLRYQQWKNQVAIDKEKKSLESQISALNKKNQDLSDSLSYLGSSDFKERTARQQLNLKRDGEVVFGFTDAPTSTPPQNRALATANMPNYEKWIEYFFWQ